MSNTLQERFDELKQEWHEETCCISNVNKILLHPSHLKIIALGKDVIPLILTDLEKETGHWFYALQVLTNVAPTDVRAGSMVEAQEWWVNWGREQGYLTSSKSNEQ